MRKKISMLLFICCNIFVLAQNQAKIEISSQNNDVEVSQNNTAYFTSSDLELHGKDGASSQETFLRFEGVTLPSDAIINNAYIVFYGDEASNSGTIINIKGEIGSSLPYPTSTAASTGINIKSRNYTSSSVTWSTTTCVVNQQYNSPELKGLLQQMFPSGILNANIAFRFTGNEQGAFTVKSSSASAGYRPTLVIDYWSATGSATAVISGGNNDAEQILTSGDIYLDSGVLELGGKTGPFPQITALRFDNVQIPANAQIVNAYIELYSYGSNAANAELKFRTELGNSLAYNTTRQNITSRKYSKRQVNWGITSLWNFSNTKQTSPNLKNIIDENRLAGWQSGQSMAFLIEGNGGIANAWSANGPSNYRPRLVVEFLNNNQGPDAGPMPPQEKVIRYATLTNNDATQYLTSGNVDINLGVLSLSGGTSSSPQINTIKFDGIDIPLNAEITDAYIEFSSYGTANTFGSKIKINSEIGNPSVYTNTANQVTGRNYSASQVVFSTANLSFPIQHEQKFRTPNLSAIIRENRLKGWQPGQSLAFKFESLPESVSSLNVFSRNGNELLQPRLVIEYSNYGIDSGLADPVHVDGEETIYYVANSENDAAENISTGNVNLYGLLNFKTGTNAEINTVKFDNVAIPEGTKVVNAWIEFYKYGNSSTPAKIKISSELRDATVYTSTRNSITKRDYTTIQQEWNAVSENNASNQAIYKTPNLKNIIHQNILDGWKSGQNLAFKFETVEGSMITYSRDSHELLQPRLKIVLADTAEPLTIEGIEQNPANMTQLYINEVSSQGTMSQDDDWIELYNNHNYPVYFNNENSGVYVSNKNGNRTLHELKNLCIPAKGFLVVSADESPEAGDGHLNFKLKNSGEKLYLSRKVNGTVIQQDYVDFPEMSFNESYGRMQDGSGAFAGFIKDSYNKTNQLSKLNLITGISHKRGVYPTGFNLSITAPSGSTIRYTVNGAFPSETVGTVYTGPIPINKNSVVKYYAYDANGNNSGVIANSYFLSDGFANETGWEYKNNITSSEYAQSLSQIPIVSLSTNNSLTNSIYQRSSFEYIDNNINSNNKTFYSNSGVTIFGQESSAYWPNPGIKVKFSKEWDVKKAEYNFFEAIPGDLYPPSNKFNSIQLKEGQDGPSRNVFGLGYSRFSEKIFMNTQKQMGKFALNTKFVHLYVNGAYKGIKTMRDDFSQQNLEEYFGDDSKNYTHVNMQDGLWSFGVVYSGDGDPQKWSEVRNAAASKNFQLFKQKVDVDDYIKFMLMYMMGDTENEAIAIGHNDAPNFTKFRFMINDTDGGFFKQNWVNGGTYQTKWNNYGYGLHGPGTLFSPFIGNNGNLEFKTLVKDQVLMQMQTDGAPLTAAALQAKVQSAAQELDLIYKVDAAWLAFSSNTYNLWKQSNTRIINEMPERVNYNIAKWLSHGLAHTLSKTTINCAAEIIDETTVTITNPNSGTQVYYTINGTDPMGNDGIVSPDAKLYNTGFLLPVGNYTIVSRAFTTNNWGPITYQAVKVTKATAGKLVISGINYRPQSNADAEFLLLSNAGNKPLDLTGYTISDAINYIFPAGTTLAPNQTMMLVKNTSLITGFNALPKYQWTSGSLSNDGETITFKDATGNVADVVAYSKNSPWPTQANGLGYYLKLINNNLDNALPQSWEAVLINSNNSTAKTTLEEKPEEEKEKEKDDKIDIEPKANVKVYPNPVSSELHIDMPVENSVVYIYNLSGKLEFTTRLKQKQNIVNISYLPTAMYIMRIVDSNNKAETFKIIKK